MTEVGGGIGPTTDLSELYPMYQALIALAALAQCLGMVQAIVDHHQDDPTREDLMIGWTLRCLGITEWAVRQYGEVAIFGEAFDNQSEGEDTASS